MILRTCRSYKISLLIIIALCINVSTPLYSQALLEKAKSGISSVGKTIQGTLQDIDISKGVQAAGKVIKELDIPGKIQEIARSTSSKIKNSLAEKLSQLQDVGPKFLIPKLLENIDKFGQQIGYIANCMFKGTCSEQERAAFIAISITILALTTALIGFSITVAATSKEIDDKTVAISQEVKGWSLQQIVTRINNTTNSFKQNLLSLQTCLLKRQCTKTQKNGLYGFAITLTILALILTGASIGAYMYSQQKAKERAEDAGTAQQVPVPSPSKPILGLMGSFTDALPTWKTKFMQQVTKVIQPVKGAGATLKSAYETIQQEIQKGAITTSKQAMELFEKITLKAKNIDELIRETLDVNLASALDQFNTLKNQFVSLKNALPELWSKDLIELRKQLENLIAYGQQTAQGIQDARDAWKHLNIGRIAQAKITSEREFADKKAQVALEQEELSKNKFALQQEIDAFYAAQQETEPSGTAAKKPSLGQKIKQKIGTTKDTSEQIRQKMAGFEKRQKQLEQQEAKLQDKLTLLNRQIAFDQFVRKKNLDGIYNTFVDKINGLKLSSLDLLLGDLVGKQIIDIIKSPATLPMSGKIGLIITVGLSAVQNNIKGGLQHIADGVERFARYAKEATSVTPLITAPKMDAVDLAKALIETGANIDLIKDGARKISAILKLKQPILDTANALEKSINNLESAIKNFRPTVVQKFVDTITASPLTTIPKAPVVLLASLAEGIRMLKVSFLGAFKETAHMLQHLIQLVPDAFSITNEFNEFFQKTTGAPFINPLFMQALSNLQTSSLPDINEGMKTLIKSLQDDMPEPEHIAIGS